jgi:hypothetical protein
MAENEMQAAIKRRVAAELDAQDAKWGEQRHADGTGHDRRPLVGILTTARLLADEKVDLDARADVLERWARVDCQSRGGTGIGSKPDTWTAILLEEVFEALASDDTDDLQTELVQVAAVAIQWATAIERRRARV